MRVLDVTQFYSPFGGGVKRYLTEKRAFVERHTQDEHILVVPGSQDHCERVGRLTLHTIASPAISLTSRYRVLLRLRRLREIIRHEKPDLIESGDPYHVAWVAIEEARRLGVPVAGFYHSHFPEAYLRTAARWGGPGLERTVLARARRYVRRLYCSFDATLVCAEPLRRVLRSWGVSTVQAVRLGADMDIFRPGAPDPDLRRTLGVPEDAFLLTYVGRLVREKNVPVLLDAFEDLLRTSPERNWWLLAVGQGPLLARVKKLQQRCGRVVWTTGFGDKESLARLYRTSDLIVHPSVNETFGLVPVEAQACGRLVAGIRGGNLELNVRAGLEAWSPTNTAPGFATTIRRMSAMERSGPESLAAALVKAEFAWPVVLGELWEVYRRLIREHRPRIAEPLV